MVVTEEIDLDEIVDGKAVDSNDDCDSNTNNTGFTANDKAWQLPTLFRVNNRGDIRVYIIGFDGHQSLMSSWGNLEAYQSGHMQTSYTEITLNTSGRGYDEQAQLEANNSWKRKQELEGYRETIIDKNIYECEAMLASDFTDNCLKAGDYPVYVQPKLDGTRCRADDYSVTAVGQVINLISRGSQVINYFEHIRRQLVDFIAEAKRVMVEWWPDRDTMLRLDGELFTFDPEVDFDKLSGATRLQNYRSQYESRVNYYIFDVDFSFDVEYPTRWSLLHTVFTNLIAKKKEENANIEKQLILDGYSVLDTKDDGTGRRYPVNKVSIEVFNKFIGAPYIVDSSDNPIEFEGGITKTVIRNDGAPMANSIVMNNIIENDQELRVGNLILVMSYEAADLTDIYELQTEFEEAGYEGAIIRRIEGKRSYYCYGRATTMYKLKSSQDAEFMVVKGESAKGRENGCIIWTLKTPEGRSFKVRPCGKLDDRKQAFRDYQQCPQKYHGQLYRVRFQDYTKLRVPRFPRGIGFVYDRTPAEVGYSVGSRG